MLLKSFTWRLLWLTVLAIAHLGAHAAPGRSRIIRSSGPDKIAGRYIIRLDPQATTAHIDTLVQQIVTDNDDFTRPDLSAKVKCCSNSPFPYKFNVVYWALAFSLMYMFNNDFLVALMMSYVILFNTGQTSFRSAVAQGQHERSPVSSTNPLLSICAAVPLNLRRCSLCSKGLGPCPPSFQT